jgi:integrase
VVDLRDATFHPGMDGFQCIRRLQAVSLAQLEAIDLHFHDLRHEGASRLLEAGWPLHHVQEMLGHSSIQQTSTYLNVTATGLQASMRKSDAARIRCNPVAISTTVEQPLDSKGDDQNDGNGLLH